MPIVLQGFDRTIYFLDQFEIELSLEMNAKIERVMRPIAVKARGYMPSTLPPGLSGWGKEPVVGNAFYRTFPIFDETEMKQGINYRSGLQKQTRRGFQRAYAVTNESAAGAIYETAGRKHPNGIPNKSRSGVTDWNGVFHKNPDAGKHFIDALPPVTRATRKKGSQGRSKKTANGRAIFRAWNEDNGRVYSAVYAAISKASNDFNKKHSVLKVA